MFETAIIVCIGLIGGVAVGTQAPIVGAMGQRVGVAAGSVIVHAGGLVASLLLLFSRGGVQIAEFRNLPWYMFCSGFFGLVLYLSLGHTIPKLGAASAITLVVVGQLFAGMVIDHFGIFEVTIQRIDMNRIIATILLLAGAYLMVR